MGAHVERERKGLNPTEMKQPKLCGSAVMATPSRPRWRSARKGSAGVVGWLVRGVGRQQKTRWR